MKDFKKDKLSVKVFEDRRALGAAAADAFTKKVNELLTTRDYINIIFGSAPSQDEFLAGIITRGIEWNRINAFHMDEYVGLDPEAPQGFGNFLKDRLFQHVVCREIYYMNGNAPDIQLECARYAGLLSKYPADIVNLGIGENTHLAFNDPHVADFNDPLIVKVVDLDIGCRTQQVNDGCFATLGDVPTHAITITIPALIKSPYAQIVVPGPLKANAVFHTLNSDISELYPSAILRTHNDATLFLDKYSASKL